MSKATTLQAASAGRITDVPTSVASPMDPHFGKLPDGSKDYRAIARAQLENEDRAEFERRVTVRARRIEEEHRRLVVSDFPTGAAELKARLDELVAREAELKIRQKAIYPAALSAVEDHELTVLARRIHEMRKRARQLGLIPKEAA